MERIAVVIKRPGENPYRTNISPSLQNLQEHVGGYVECVKISNDLYVLCNEEGKIRGDEPNCCICGFEFVGTIIFIGVDGEEFAPIPLTWQGFKQLFDWLFKGEK